MEELEREKTEANQAGQLGRDCGQLSTMGSVSVPIRRLLYFPSARANHGVQISTDVASFVSG